MAQASVRGPQWGWCEHAPQSSSMRQLAGTPRKAPLVPNLCAHPSPCPLSPLPGPPTCLRQPGQNLVAMWDVGAALAAGINAQPVRVWAEHTDMVSTLCGVPGMPHLFVSGEAQPRPPGGAPAASCVQRAPPAACSNIFFLLRSVRGCSRGFLSPCMRHLAPCWPPTRAPATRRPRPDNAAVGHARGALCRSTRVGGGRGGGHASRA